MVGLTNTKDKHQKAIDSNVLFLLSCVLAVLFVSLARCHCTPHVGLDMGGDYLPCVSLLFLRL